MNRKKQVETLLNALKYKGMIPSWMAGLIRVNRNIMESGGINSVAILTGEGEHWIFYVKKSRNN